MAFPKDPRDTTIEFFINSSWVDVTADVYGREPLVITSGRADESQAFSPAACGFTLNNRAGLYNPRNPLGTYYGKIGRNTPVRVRVRTAKDSFNRTVVNGWGTADTGQAYALAGLGGSPQASDFQVAGGFATHSVPATAAFRASYFPLTILQHRNVDVAVTVSIPFTNVTGGIIEPANVMFHVSNTPSYWLVRVAITTAEAVQIWLVDPADNDASDTVTVPGLTHSSSQALRVRAQCDGRYFRAKVWPAASSEPFDWHLVAQHTGLTAGGVGVRSGVASGNTNALPIVFTYSDLQISVPRFAGEVSTWNQRWNDGIIDAITAVEASGIMRRLGQGTAVLGSAPRREILANNPDAYWPLEDGPLADAGEPAVGAARMTISGDVDPSRQWGQGQLAAWLPNVVSRQGVGELRASGFGQPSFAGVWSTSWIMAGGRAHNDVVITGHSPTIAAVQTWKVEFSLTADDVQVTDAETDVSGVAYARLFDGAAHHVEFSVGGYSSGWSLRVDGQEVLSGGFAGTLQSVSSIRFRNLVDPGSEALTIGHVKIASQTVSASERSAALGWVAETAGDRLSRLSQSVGVPFTWIGPFDPFLDTPIDTVTMGAQFQDSLTAVFSECAQADMGELYEPRGAIGLEYRTLKSIYNQSSSLTLNFAADHLAPPLEPVDDDQLTRNKVTVSRRNGGSFEAELTTGPLSTLDPSAGGIGTYDTNITVNVQRDDQVMDAAGWILHLGTFDGARYPQIRVSLGRPAIANTVAMANAAMDVNIGDRIVVTNAAAIKVYDDITLIVRGIVESIDAFDHHITFNCTPEEPYHVRDWGEFRWDSDDSRLSGSTLSTSGLSCQVAFDKARWTTDPAHFPLNFNINGEVVTVSAISSTTSPQTFTISARAVNGVSKSHAVNSNVSLADRSYWGR